MVMDGRAAAGTARGGWPGGVAAGHVDLAAPVGAGGGVRGVLEASVAAFPDGAPVLAVVLEIVGSTYAQVGAIALFSARGQAGWLSGGCLEPRIAEVARRAAAARRVGWLEIDTRDDDALFGGSAVGCRGRLRLALLPLAPLACWPELVAAWREGAGPLRLEVDTTGHVSLGVAARAVAVDLGGAAPTWGPLPATGGRWTIDVPPPPSLLVFGAGPESPTLLPLLRSLGWRTTLVERRERWRALGALADVALADGDPAAVASRTAHEAALVMHHNFELDREALAALAVTATGFVGLLGPARRREDLFRVLPAAARELLAPRLHSPVGLPLGGHGPEAIALSIAAELQAHLHARA